MFKSCKVQLLQPRAGIRPGADLATEKWIVVKLVLGGQVAHTGSVFGMFAELADYPLQGRYFFDSNNMTPETNDGYIIGGSELPHVKFWRYDVKNFQLFFSTLETWTGGGAMSMDDNPIVIRDDLELYDVKSENSVPFETNISQP